MKNRIHEAALEYQRRGWAPLPLGERSKIPAVPWAEFHSRLPNEQELHKWFAEHPERNIGIVTGRVSGIVVVDFDPARGGHFESWLKRFPTNCIVQTGSGGWHLYYSYPRGAKNVPNAVDIEPGTDIRGDGGQVVAPPSTHQKGGEYTWLKTGALGAFPIQFQGEENQPHNRPGWISALLEQGAPDGQRNDSLAKLAGYCQMLSMSEDVAISLAMLWNSKLHPPLDVDEIKRTVRSVYKTASRRDVVVPATVSVDSVVNNSDFDLVALESFMRTFGGMAEDWLIENWLPERTIAFCISAPGSYKTWLLLDLAISIASGTDFLGHFPVKRKAPVMLVQQEDYHGQTAERLAVIMKSRFNIGIQPAIEDRVDDVCFNTPPNLPIYVHLDRKLRFDDTKAMKGLADAVEKIRPALIILDPLYSAAATDDYMAKTASGNMFLLKDLRDEFGCSFLVAHHTKKAEDATRQRLWGSQFLNAFLETGWQVNLTDTPSVITVNRHFKAAANAPEQKLRFNIETKYDFVYDVALEEKSPLGADVPVDDMDADDAPVLKKRPAADVLDGVARKRTRDAKKPSPARSEKLQKRIEAAVPTMPKSVAILRDAKKPMTLQKLAVLSKTTEGKVFADIRSYIETGLVERTENKQYRYKTPGDEI